MAPWLASALITSRVTRRARSQRPRASSARVIHSRVGTAFVFCRMLAKNVHAIAKSPLPYAASPSACHAPSCAANDASSEKVDAAAPAAAAATSTSDARVKSPSSMCALDSLLKALALFGSSFSAASQSVIAPR